MRHLALLLSLLVMTASSALAADLEAGKRVFNKCRICHAVGPNPRTMQGPHLNGVVGRSWGAVDGYKYSSGRDDTLLAIHEAEPRVWDIATLTAYLRRPKDIIPKGKMVFPGLTSDDDIEAVILYLASFDSDGNETDPEAVLEALAEAEQPEGGTAAE